MAQNPINDELLEDLLEYNNKMTCVRDTMSSIQQSDLMIVNNIENGKSNRRADTAFSKPLSYLRTKATLRCELCTAEKRRTQCEYRLKLQRRKRL